MRKRKVWIEPMFAEAKQWHGMERVRLRRLERVNTEVLVTAAGQNVNGCLRSDLGGRGERLRPRRWGHPEGGAYARYTGVARPNGEFLNRLTEMVP